MVKMLRYVGYLNEPMGKNLRIDSHRATSLRRPIDSQNHRSPRSVPRYRTGHTICYIRAFSEIDAPYGQMIKLTLLSRLPPFSSIAFRYLSTRSMPGGRWFMGWDWFSPITLLLGLDLSPDESAIPADSTVLFQLDSPRCLVVWNWHEAVLIDGINFGQLWWLG